MTSVTTSPGASRGRSFDIGTSLDRALNTYYEKGTTWIPWVDADGVATRTLVKPLARNALVRAYTVRVGAARADFTALANAGQVRLQAESGGSKIIVVDFGMLRTVSGIGRVGGDKAPSLTICSLRAFRGDAFDTTDLYLEDCAATDIDGMLVRSIEQNTFETRTDRVRISVKTAAALPAIADALWLQFPDLPTDLDLRVNGGTPPWQAPGVAQPNVHGWNADTEQDVDLTAALASLAGDATDAAPLDATIVLSSRIPGQLTLDTLVEDVAYLGRITFAGSEQVTLTLPEEGDYDVDLQLPEWVKEVEELRLVATATAPTERILEPVGPPIALQAGGSGAAYDLLLDVDHAGSARLDQTLRLAELTAIRLPLRAGADGAEVRVVVHEGNAEGPIRPAAGGTTTPVDLPPAADDAGDGWTTFALPKALKLFPTTTYWAVIVVGRGAVQWSLGRFPDAASVVPIRRGMATGPWYSLPSVGAGADTLGARVRIVGKAPSTAPIAPLSIGVAGSAATVDVTPTPKGVAATWLPPGAIIGTTHPSFPPTTVGGAPGVTLRLTSRMVGSVTLSAVDVVASK
jgi:hypothetical protein